MEWHGTAKMGGQAEATALPSSSEAHRVGKSLDSKEDIVYVQGKAGLAEATSSQTVSTASLTAPLG